MPIKKPTKRRAPAKPMTAFDAKQAELDAARRLRKINQAIAGEMKAAQRWLTRADATLSLVMAAHNERTGMILVDGATYAGLCDRVQTLQDENNVLRVLRAQDRDEARETAAAGA
jgi:hypothetical protein